MCLKSTSIESEVYLDYDKQQDDEYETIKNDEITLLHDLYTNI